MARLRFSIAHELGHFVLSHRPISFRSSSALPAAVQELSARRACSRSKS
ncbi:MAG: ImmA/IrrE family metallo-endopeptidase [Acetomicrobium sp.]|nr:ImmA/IrrE family metallo-endopeptidase [Acetomicrobium sp.]